MKTKTNINTVAKALERVRDISLSEDPRNYEQSRYICNCLKNLQEEKLISKSLLGKALAYLVENRPTEDLHPEFYNYEHYVKEDWRCAWWNVHKTVHTGVYVIEEKKRFLTVLINQLKT